MRRPNTAWFAILTATLVGACVPVGSRPRAGSAFPPEDAGVSVLSLLWRQATTELGRNPAAQEFAAPEIVLAPHRGEDVLYQGTRSGWFFAIEAATGKTLWKKKLGAVSTQAVAFRGRLFVGTEDGFLLCLDLGGKEMWRYATRSPILQAPVVADDAVLVANEGGQVHSVDRLTGASRWVYKAELDEDFTLRGHAGIAVSEELAFTGFANGKLVALRLTTGSVAWVTSLRGGETRFVDVDTTPVLTNGALFAASSAAGLYSLNPENGRINWHREISSVAGIAASENRLYVMAADAGAYAMDMDGNTLWRQGNRGGGEPSVPVLVGDYMIYSLANAGVFVAERRTGTVVQFFDPGYGVSAAPTASGRSLYVISNNAILYSFNLHISG